MASVIKVYRGLSSAYNPVTHANGIFFTTDTPVSYTHLSNIPVMYVVEKVTRSYKHNDETVNSFKGIKCRWFNVNGDQMCIRDR